MECHVSSYRSALVAVPPIGLLRFAAVLPRLLCARQFPFLGLHWLQQCGQFVPQLAALVHGRSSSVHSGCVLLAVRWPPDLPPTAKLAFPFAVGNLSAGIPLRLDRIRNASPVAAGQPKYLALEKVSEPRYSILADCLPTICGVVRRFLAVAALVPTRK